MWVRLDFLNESTMLRFIDAAYDGGLTIDDDDINDCVDHLLVRPNVISHQKFTELLTKHQGRVTDEPPPTLAR